MRIALLTGLLAMTLFGVPTFAAGPAAIPVPAADAGSSSSARQSVSEASTARAGTAGEIAITIDRAKIIRLPEGARTVVVGNPSIADLSVQKAGVVIVTGRSYGVTNLIALDMSGNMLAESTLSVRAPTGDTVVVLQRGPDSRQSYSCAPACMPSTLLGDGTTYFNDVKSNNDRYIQSSLPK